MPTKEKLEGIDIALVRYILETYLKRVSSSNVLLILPYVYELTIVLICAEAGLETTLDKYCISEYEDWRLLLRVRNICSHNIYDTKTVRRELTELLNSRILYDVFVALNISQVLYLQLHYSIVFLLRKENIYE